MDLVHTATAVKAVVWKPTGSFWSLRKTLAKEDGFLIKGVYKSYSVLYCFILRSKALLNDFEGFDWFFAWGSRGRQIVVA